MKLSPDVEKAIGEVIKKYSEAYRSRDFNAVLSLYLESEDTVLIGSDRGDIAFGYSKIKNILRREFLEWDALDFNLECGSLQGSDAVAWITTISEVKIGEQRTIGRFTATLQKRSDKWLFVQTHFSFPVRL